MTFRSFMLLWLGVFSLAFCADAEEPCKRVGAQVVCGGAEFDLFAKKYVTCTGDRDTCAAKLTTCEKDLEDMDKALSTSVVYTNSLTRQLAITRMKAQWGLALGVAGTALAIIGPLLPQMGVTTQVLTVAGGLTSIGVGIALTL